MLFRERWKKKKVGKKQDKRVKSREREKEMEEKENKERGRMCQI